LAKKQEAEKELKAKEAELDVVTVAEEKESIESEADSLSIEEIKSKITSSNEDFDWDADDKKFGNYNDAEREKLEKLYDGTFSSINKGEIITGTVVNVNSKDVVLNIGFKSDGLVSLSEFRDTPDLKIGDTVEVFVESQEDANGQLVLSRKRAKTQKSWERINSALDNDEIITGFVKSRTKGGLIVDVFGIEAFLPGSQIDVKPVTDYDQFVGKTMEFKVVKINEAIKNAVVSHKALIESDIEAQRAQIIGKLEKGQVLEGVVKNITSYGVFIDLGGVDGLIHITDLSWSRINHPSEVLELDQKLNVVILDFDDEKTRIQLGLKQLNAHPWDALSADLKVGDKVNGKVVVIADYGAFIEVAEGVEGLIHVSEMSWSTHLRSAQDFVKVGDVVEAVILTLDREDRKMSLGIKQLSQDPWTDITSKYPVGSKHTGIVRNFTNFGIFVELEEGIDGLIYISDLSWTKKIKHPSEFINVGEKLDVVVLELDVDGRKLSLGHKQTTANPWDKYEDSFAVGTIHNGEISEIVDKGATVEFGDDIVAFIPTRHLEKEDGKKLKKGDKADFKVIEFNKEFKRVVASHTATFREEEEKNVKAAAESTTSTNQPSTLGDNNDILAELKAKMEKGGK